MNTPSLNPHPSTLSSLLDWSLQFDVPAWLILLVLAALGVVMALELRYRLNRRHAPQDLARNRREAVAGNLLIHNR